MDTITTPLSVRLPAAVCLAFAVTLFGMAPLATAQQAADPVKIALVAKKIIVTENGETAEPATTSKPGDLLQYEAIYRNTSPGAVGQLLATVPVPERLALVAASATPAGALASTDGQHFAPMPLMRAVRQADGTVVQQPVPLSEYRALRWTISELAAGERATVRLRAQVLSNAPTK